MNKSPIISRLAFQLIQFVGNCHTSQVNGVGNEANNWIQKNPSFGDIFFGIGSKNHEWEC